MSDTADALLRRIEAIDTAAADNRHRAESYARMSAALKDVQGRATSDDGVVTVVASPDGAVRSITFSDRVGAVAPAALSAVVLHTIAKARADAARMQAEIVRDGLGDTHLLDQVLAADTAQFGDERPRDPGPAPTPAPAPRPSSHDDEGEFSVFNNQRSAW